MDGTGLFLRSDGFCDYGNGYFAVIMLKSTNTDGNITWLNYKTTFTGPTIRVEWKAGEDLAILPENVAKGLVRLQYARNLSQDEVDQINAAYAESPPTPLEPAPTAALPTPSGGMPGMSAGTSDDDKSGKSSEKKDESADNSEDKKQTTKSSGGAKKGRGKSK